MVRCKPNAVKERNTAARNILLAEDNEEMRAMLALALRDAGYTITECPDGVDLLMHLTPLVEHTGTVEYDLIISDIRMPGLTSMEILEGLTGNDAMPPVVLITAFGDSETHEAARRCGVAVTINKPFEISDFLAAVGKVLRTT